MHHTVKPTRRAWLAALVLLVISGKAIAAANPTVPPVETANSPFGAASEFQPRITVRVTGMPLAELLPRMGRELGVVLRPAAEEIGDIRVSVFAEELPARRVLDALTAMLNMTPEGGFTWHRLRERQRPVFELRESVQTRQMAAERLKSDAATLLQRFQARARALGSDPEMRKLWANPEPIPRMQRATQLIAALTDDQMGKLTGDGLLVLRAPEVSPEQRRIIERLAADQLGTIERFLQEHPDQRHRYENLNPAQFTVALERQLQPPGLSIVMRLDLGPEKGGSRYPIFSVTNDPDRETGQDGGRDRGTGGEPPLPGRVSTDPAPSSTTGTAGNASIPQKATPERTATPLQLRPRSGTMADALSELARRSGVALISDCYTRPWESLAALPPRPLEAILREIDRQFSVRWEWRDGILLLRSRSASARRASEVSQRSLSRWLGQVRRDRAVRLETLAEMARLSDAQLNSQRWQPEIERVFPNLHLLVWGSRQVLQIYALLPPARRAQVQNGSLLLSYADMTPAQRQQFRYWLMLHMPEAPEARYESAVLSSRLLDRRRWEIEWSVDGRRRSMTQWLEASRNWNTGEILDRPPLSPEALRGRPAPPLTVWTLDGQFKQLPFPEGRKLLAYFRDTWVVPYVGTVPDSADLKLMAKLLARRPDLRDRVAVIYRGEKAAELRLWHARFGRALPAYADETGAVTRAYGGDLLPHAVVIDEQGRIGLIRDGYDSVMATDWERQLP